jgi:hypothetical protein
VIAFSPPADCQPLKNGRYPRTPSFITVCSLRPVRQRSTPLGLLRRAVGSLSQRWLRRHRFSACFPGSPASTALTGADSRSIARRAGVACVSACTLDSTANFSFSVGDSGFDCCSAVLRDLANPRADVGGPFDTMDTGSKGLIPPSLPSHGRYRRQPPD